MILQLLLPLVSFIIPSAKSLSEAPLVLLVSFDGFRWDYLDMVKKAGKETPHFDGLIKDGSKAQWVKNTFSTVTFPNHYTIATGLYEEDHGVVENEMFDPDFNEVFTVNPDTVKDPKWWNNGTDSWPGEPIWIANQKGGDPDKGIVHRTGVYFWVGSEAPFNGEHPFHYELYNKTVPFQQRIDTVVEWFTDETHPINLGLLYFSEPDHTGHSVGPDSPEMIDKIVDLDTNVVAHLIEKLREHDLFDRLNMIITSDHGMAQITKAVYIDEHVSPELYTKYGDSPVWHILPKEGKFILTVRKIHLQA